MKKHILLALTVPSVFLAVPPSHADTRNNRNNSEAANYEADNTGKNVRDRDDRNLTADDQSFAKNDTDLAARVRRAITSDDSLSMNAHNVKIITENGKVTLRGPVDSANEKQVISAKAAQIAGSGNVTNQLEIDADSEGRAAPKNSALEMDEDSDTVND